MLEVHHIIFRSHGGPDVDWNLITLCKEHHMAAHRSEVSKEDLFVLNVWGFALGTLKTLERRPEFGRLCVTCKYRTKLTSDGKITCAKGYDDTSIHTYCEEWESP